jgi:hypothetical protein
MTEENDPTASTDQFKAYFGQVWDAKPRRWRRLLMLLPWRKRGYWIEIGATEGGVQLTGYDDGTLRIRDGGEEKTVE